MTPVELCAALVRTTLATSAAACLAAVLLGWLRVESPRIHRAAWTLVVLQGWLLLPWTVEIQTPPTPSEPQYEDAGSDAVDDAPIPWRRSTMQVANTPTFAEEAPWRMLSLAMLAWAAGAGLLTLTAAGRYVRIVRALPLGAALDNPQWQQEWRRQRVAMGVRSRVAFRLTDRFGPLVAYIPFAYLILAPRSVWTDLAPNERTAILRHELAHVCRRDLWKSLAVRMLALPQWFNPMVWLAVRRFDEAAEWACDAAACSSPSDRPAVAAALVHTAELTACQAPARAPVLIPAVPSHNKRQRHSAFSRRIRRLVAPKFKDDSIMKKILVPALLAIFASGQLIRIEHVAAKPAMEPAAEVAKTPTASADDADPAKRKEYVESVWPRYIIEPPDVLSIEGVKLAPKAPHTLEPFDVVLIRAQGAHPEQPIDDTYSVDADGSVNLGPSYGRIKIVGGTIEEAETRIREELAKKLPDVSVSASLVASAGAQQISGQHLVGPDGRVNLGIYGAVYVAGMTIEEARAAIEKKLSELLEHPQVAVDVLAYNSKVYYVIYKGAKLGDNVTRMPITGNETVLDAIASMGGISSVATANMWLARPNPTGGPERILPVAWNDIARGISSKTNYPLMPGDRLFIETQPPVENSQAPPTPASRVGDLRVHDVITVLVDYSAAAKDDRPSSFRIACEIRDIRANGNLQIEGKQTIRNNNEQWQISLSGDVRREAILPDGTVSSRSIANLNIDKRVVSAEAAPPTVTIVLRQDGGEMLMDQAYVTGKTIGDAIDGAVYPNPINFAKAVISLERSAGEQATAQAIGWDASRSRPTEGDDRVLEPGDRIVVTAPGYVPLPEQQAHNQAPSLYHPSDEVQSYQPAPRSEPSAPNAAGAAQVSKQNIEFHFNVFTDPNGNLSELEDFSVVDAHTARTTFRVFEKQKLVSRSIDPHVLTELGRPASIELNEESVADLRMDVSRLAINATVTKMQESSYSRSGDDAYILSVDVKQGRFGGSVQTVLARNGLKTAIIRFNPPLGERKSTDEAKPAIYVLVTPIWQ